MTLKETIKYIRLKANEQKYYASFVKKKDVLQSCKEKAEQYQQIVDWLEELKTYQLTHYAKAQGYVRKITNLIDQPKF